MTGIQPESTLKIENFIILEQPIVHKYDGNYWIFLQDTLPHTHLTPDTLPLGIIHNFPLLFKSTLSLHMSQVQTPLHYHLHFRRVQRGSDECHWGLEKK